MTATNILLIFLLFGVISCNSYRILAIFPFDGKSHNQVLQPIALELARKGHQVDVITYYPLKQPFPNYTDIIKLPPGDHPTLDYDSTNKRKGIREYAFRQKSKMCGLLGHPEISKLIKNPPNNPPYDLLLTHILIGFQCFTAIGHLWNVPVVGVVTSDLLYLMHDLIGNPMNLAITTRHLEYYKANMNFWDRLYNVIKSNYRKYNYYRFRNLEDYYIKKYLGPQLPPSGELHKSISMLLSNSHFSFYGIMPKTPALIEIGGIHITNDTDELSPSVKKYLDDSKHGFVYFSFGSIVAIESLPKPVLEKIYAALGKIAPVRIIIRVLNPDMMPKGQPDNILMFSWLPQQKVLQHPNIKAFVSHGGGLGMQEAIYYKVPLVCVPFFCEQFVNCDIASNKNISVTIGINKAQQEDFDYAFREILSNPLYKESINKFSILYFDRFQTPKEAVTYWIEYVIRHGKNVLQSPAINLKFWQVELLDVYAFLLLCILAITFIVNYILRRIFRLFINKLNLIGLINSKKDKKLS